MKKFVLILASMFVLGSTTYAADAAKAPAKPASAAKAPAKPAAKPAAKPSVKEAQK